MDYVSFGLLVFFVGLAIGGMTHSHNPDTCPRCEANETRATTQGYESGWLHATGGADRDLVDLLQRSEKEERA